MKKIDPRKLDSFCRDERDFIYWAHEFKALNRAMVAKEMGHENIYEVFFQRAYELGSVSKQDYREYKLEKLGI